MGKKNKGGNKGTQGNKQHIPAGQVATDEMGENTAYQKQQFGQPSNAKKRG